MDFRGPPTVCRDFLPSAIKFVPGLVARPRKSDYAHPRLLMSMRAQLQAASGCLVGFRAQCFQIILGFPDAWGC